MSRAVGIRSVAAALATVGLAACGTTVQGAGTGVAGGSGGGGAQSLSVPSAAASADGGAAPAQGAVPVPGSTAVGRGSGATSGAGVTASTPTRGTATSGAGRSGGLVPAAAPGVTASKIYLGIAYSSQSAAADRALGASGGAPSYDERNVFNAVIDYANAHGGFAGRKLQAIYYNENLTNDRSSENQAACSFFTQDNKVLFIYSAAQSVFYACAAKAGAVPIDGGGTGNGMTYAQYPHLVDPDDIRLDRLGSVTVNGLYRAGYFTGKLGLVTWDDPVYKYTIDHGYLPTLSSHGISPTQTAYISVPQQVGALSDTSAAVSSAVTKFRSLGIDHVIIQDGPAGVFSGAGLTFEWMNQAKSQRYYPRYGQNSGNSPGWSVLPSDQMDKAIAVDDSDSDPKYDVGWHENQARQLCFKIEGDAGYPVSSSNGNDEGIAAIACDVVFAAQRMVNAVPSITADNLVNAWQGFGTSFKSAFVYGTKLAPGRRDGADMVRNEEYFASCQCLKFQGQPYYPD
jgi:hypothetical protein